MGMPLYGRSFTLTSRSQNGLNAPATGAGAQGLFTRENGFLAYYEICHRVKNEGWTVVGPVEQIGPYAHKNKQWVSYDDKETILKKVLFKCHYYAFQQNILTGFVGHKFVKLISNLMLTF